MPSFTILSYAVEQFGADFEKASAEINVSISIPEIKPFQNEVGSDNLKETIEANHRELKRERLSCSVINRKKYCPPSLCYLIKDNSSNIY